MIVGVGDLVGKGAAIISIPEQHRFASQLAVVGIDNQSCERFASVGTFEGDAF